MSGVGTEKTEYIKKRIRACDYLCVAQLFLGDNFLLKNPLGFDDVKPRLLGHWGTCHGVNVAYANLKSYFEGNHNFSFVLGPGHGFPALQANLYIDGDLEKVDEKATQDEEGLAYVCKNFSWPDGFPSHASPYTPGVIVEGGELGYALANAYGVALGHPEKTIAVLIGDGELETATALDSLNLRALMDSPKNGKVIPILHLNGYKISAPSIYARRSERELNMMIRGFGFTPIVIDGDDPETFQTALNEKIDKPFYILKTEKGAGGPTKHHEAHQIPLKEPMNNSDELKTLEEWLRSYDFNELFDAEKGFTL
jgi:xylulose-5-phosphate/fructose-6-phosphate phosphoketolase